MNKLQVENALRRVIRKILKENWMHAAGMITKSEDIFRTKLMVKSAAKKVGINLSSLRGKAYANILMLTPDIGQDYGGVEGQLTFTQDKSDPEYIRIDLDMSNSQEDGMYLTDNFEIDISNPASESRTVASFIKQLQNHMKNLSL